MLRSRDQLLTRLGGISTNNTNSPLQPTMAFTALNNKPSAPIVPVQAPAAPAPSAPAPAPAAAPTPVPHPQEIDVAFASNHELRKRVHAAIGMPYQSNTRILLMCPKTIILRKVLYSATFRHTSSIKPRSPPLSQRQRSARSKRALPHRTAHQKQEAVSRALQRKHSRHTQPSVSRYHSERSSPSSYSTRRMAA